MKKLSKFIHKEPTKLLIYIIITLWLLSLIFQKELAPLIPVVFLLIGFMILRKPSKLILLLTLIITIFFFNQSPFAYEHMITSTLKTASHPKQPLRLIVEPNSGKHVLPHQVLKMLDMIDENEIANYQLSSTFEQDILLYQRIVESSWPIKLEEDSIYVFIYEDELIDFSDCSIIDQREGIYLVNCN